MGDVVRDEDGLYCAMVDDTVIGDPQRREDDAWAILDAWEDDIESEQS